MTHPERGPSKWGLGSPNPRKLNIDIIEIITNKTLDTLENFIFLSLKGLSTNL
mgnify:CR=1 FL=1